MDGTRVLETVATLHRQLIAEPGVPSTDRVVGLLEALVDALDLAGAALVLLTDDGPQVVAVPDTLAATETAQVPSSPGSPASGDVVREDGRLLVVLGVEDEVAGSLALYAGEGRTWPQAEVDAAAGIAGILAGVLVAARRLAEREQTIAQLQHALDSRVLIEQAKGMVAARHGVGVEEAFELVRAHARNHHVTVRAVCDAIVNLGLQLGHRDHPGASGDGGPEPG